MPIIKSAIKRTRQAAKHNDYNVAVKTSLKAKVKTVRDELATGSVKTNADLIAALTQIDKAVKKGVIKKQTAARKKSRLTLAYNAVAAKPFGTESAGQRTGKPGSKVKKPVAKKPAAKKTATKKPAAKKAPAKKPTAKK